MHIDSYIDPSTGRDSPYSALIQSSLYVYHRDGTYSSSIALKPTQLKIGVHCYLP